MKTTARNQVIPRTTVKTAYDCMDAIFTSCGIRDLTEGIYNNSKTDYETAQRTQRQWLLNEIGCTAGSRLLDIGCGYGTLLAEAKQRGAEITGITLSPRQTHYCHQQKLNVKTIDYRNVPQSWYGQFDCIVANGSAEHFVQPTDAIAGLQNDIYREFFGLCHNLLDPASPARRLATTIIHFDRTRPDPHDLLKNPWRFLWKSDRFHSAILEATLGGFYPINGQLEKCATPNFILAQATDGTEDYRRTSEEWLKMIRQSLLRPRRLTAIAGKLMPRLFTSPKKVILTLGLLITESWQWQFRGEHPPTKLWRHVWQHT